MRGAGPVRVLAVLVCLFGGGLASSLPTAAQQIAAPPAPSTDSMAPPPLTVSPTGAFLRALAVPGWGHSAIGSYTRGGFYFGFETATAYALVRTRMRLSEARERAALQESASRARLAVEGITDPDEIESRLEEDETLRSFEDLVRSREGQQEDLVAFGIFLLLLAGADAYVSAHLSRFPAPIELQGGYSSDGRAEVGLSVRLPR